MSLTRSILNELCNYVAEKCSSLFGNKFWDCRLVCAVDYGNKPEKLEQRIFVISKFRIFILQGKTPVTLKIDRFFHILSIRVIHLINDDELCISLDESATSKRRLFIRSENSSKLFASNILAAIKHYFPDCAQSLRSLLDLVPSDLYDEFDSLASARPLLACHNFRRSYAALCDLYEQPFRDEVVWDIEKIYALHHLRTLRLDDFTHLLPRDLIPILAVCQYSSFFTGIYAEGLKLSPELIETIISVVRYSYSLKSLVLINSSLPRDFVALFANALHHNTNIPLEYIDFSKNNLEDKKGFAALSSILPKIKTLRSLSFSECALSEKCINILSSGLYQGLKSKVPSDNCQLSSLVFSGNSLKDEPIELFHVLSLCTSLRTLDLSDSGLNIDKLWSPLMFGGLQLETLRLRGCQSSRRCKESAQQMKEYFSAAVNFKLIDFSNTLLHSEPLKGLLLGLASNRQLKPFCLTLDGVCDRTSPTVLETCLNGLDLHTLSLRDNQLEFDIQPVIAAVSGMPNLVKLDLSGANFSSLRRSTKHSNILSNVLLEVVKLVGEEDSHLKELILSDCRLASHLSVLLNTLGVASSLQLLDISGNEMGNFGARLLAKALQINISLKTVIIDRNQITGDGFADIANALKLNKTLISLPYPIMDVAESLNRADRVRTLAAISEIESLIEKNRMEYGQNDVSHRSKITFLYQELAGTVMMVDRMGDSGEKLLNLIKNLPPVELGDLDLENLVDESLVELEEKAIIEAKDHLGALKNLVESEGISGRMSPIEQTSPFRNELISKIVHYLRDVKWRKINNFVEIAVADYRTHCNNDDKKSLGSWQHSSTDSPKTTKSDSFSLAASKSHRPKSVVTDLSGVEGVDFKLTFDSPPVVSELKHVSKNRPRPARNFKGTRPTAHSMDDPCDITFNTQMDDEIPIYDLAANESPASPQISMRSSSLISDTKPDLTHIERSVTPQRIAVLPPVNPPNKSSTTSTSPLSTSVPAHLSTPLQPSAPPIVPRRNRVGPLTTPPSLPPKPDNALNRPMSCSTDNDTPSNKRKSVADMARMFSSADSPLSRRT